MFEAFKPAVFELRILLQTCEKLRGENLEVTGHEIFQLEFDDSNDEKYDVEDHSSDITISQEIRVGQGKKFFLSANCTQLRLKNSRSLGTIDVITLWNEDKAPQLREIVLVDPFIKAPIFRLQGIFAACEVGKRIKKTLNNVFTQTDDESNVSVVKLNKGMQTFYDNITSISKSSYKNAFTQTNNINMVNQGTQTQKCQHEIKGEFFVSEEQLRYVMTRIIVFIVRRLQEKTRNIMLGRKTESKSMMTEITIPLNKKREYFLPYVIRRANINSQFIHKRLESFKSKQNMLIKNARPKNTIEIYAQNEHRNSKSYQIGKIQLKNPQVQKASYRDRNEGSVHEYQKSDGLNKIEKYNKNSSKSEETEKTAVRRNIPDDPITNFSAVLTPISSKESKRDADLESIQTPSHLSDSVESKSVTKNEKVSVRGDKLQKIEFEKHINTDESSSISKSQQNEDKFSSNEQNEDEEEEEEEEEDNEDEENEYEDEDEEENSSSENSEKDEENSERSVSEEIVDATSVNEDSSRLSSIPSEIPSN